MFDPFKDWPGFTLSITGVDDRNSDRTKRQDILVECCNGDEVQLVRDRENKYDKCAIRVMWKGLQIGWIPAGDYFLARHMDSGLEVRARIVNLPECRFYNDGTIRCIVQIAKQPIEESPLRKFYVENVEIQAAIAESKNYGASHFAIRLLLRAMQRIKRLTTHPNGRYFRTVRYPVSRLVLMLANYGKPISALRVAEWWTRSDDNVGITEPQKEVLHAFIEHVKARRAKGESPYDTIELSNAIKKKKLRRLGRLHCRRNKRKE